MVRQVAVQFQGLIPAIDRKRMAKPFVVNGKNFLVAVDGPLSAFGKVDVLLAALEFPEYIKSFRISSSEVFVFTKNSVLKFDSLANAFVPVYVFTALATVFPWSHALVGGIHYFVREGTNLLQYNATTGQWISLSGGDYPIDPYTVTQSAGRLVIVSRSWVTWSAIDDGTDIATSTATGAGAQSLAILGDGIPQAVHQTADGFITFTESGILKSEIITAANPFRHYVLTNDTIAIGPYAIVDLGEKTHVFLTKTGLYSTAGKTPELWQPLMSEYFHVNLLPTLDLTQDAIVRLSYDIDRAWFIISLAEQQQTGVYTKAFVFDKRSEQWGSFDQNHSGFLDVNFTSGSLIGFNFGFVSPEGNLYRFSDAGFDSLFPALTWNLYNYVGKPEYPARYEASAVAFPSVTFIRPVDESVFPQLGLFDTYAVLEEAIEPVLQTVDNESVTTANDTLTVTDSFTDTVGTVLSSHVGELGAVWVDQQFGVTAARIHTIIGNYYVYATGSNLNAYASGVPIDADYSIETYIRVRTKIGNIGIAVHHSTTDESYYAVVTDGFVWTLLRDGGYNANDILGSFTENLNTGVDYLVKLSFVANELRVYINGALRITAIDTTGAMANDKGRAAVLTVPYSPFITNAVTTSTSTGIHISDIQVISTAIVYSLPANTQLSQGIQHIYNAVVENNVATLDSFVEVGPFRMPSENDIDELGLVNSLNVAMLDAGAGDSTDDWMNDYPSDISEDWLVLVAEEDWGFAAAASADADISIRGTIDGYATWEEQEFSLTEFITSGRSKLYDVQCNGLYQLVKLDATAVNKSIALKMMELNFFPTGRL